MQQVCNLSVILAEYLCVTILKQQVMDKEKAKKIQRYYDYFRFVVIILFVGLLLFMAS